MGDRALELADAMARQFEGLHRVAGDGLVYPYRDPVGFPTIGYGKLLSRDKTADLSQWPPITPDEAAEQLQAELSATLKRVERLVRAQITDEQAAALCDFAFNLGAGALQVSSLLRMLNRGDTEGAADQFGRWVYAGAVRLPGLVRRRAAERELFMAGAN